MALTQKRPLPPTPSTSTKYTNVNDVIQSLLLDTSYENLTDKERKWYNDLSNCHKSIEQKDSTIDNLKTIVMEWKKKAIDYENAYKNAVKGFEDREQFLIKQHQAEMEAMTKIQVDQVNDHLDLILELQKENELLKVSSETDLLSTTQPRCQKIATLQKQQQQQFPYSNSNYGNLDFNSSTSQLCNTAQVANQAVSETVYSSQENSDELIQRINDMVHAIEGTLHNLNYLPSEESSPPPLISDTSSVSSSEGINHEEKPIAPKKKRSVRNSSLPNFLFKNKKKTIEANQQDFPQQKRTNSLNEQFGIHKDPSGTASLLSSH